MKLLKILHRWVGIPIGILFFITLLSGVINGGEELFQILRKYDQQYRVTSLEEDAHALAFLVQQHPTARQYLMPTEQHPFYQSRVRGETTTYSIGDLTLLHQEISQGGFFSTVLGLHRSLLLGREEVVWTMSGRDIVAWGGLISILLSLFGLYLWWPMRRAFRLKSALPANTQRSSLQKSHINLGVLVLVVVLLLGLTGAAITYRPIARTVLSAQQLSADGIFSQPRLIQTGWLSWLRAAKSAMPTATLDRISMPRNRGGDNPVDDSPAIDPAAAMQFRFNGETDWFGLAASKVYIDKEHSALIGVSAFGSRSVGQRLYELVSPLHTGRGLTASYLIWLLIPTIFTVLMVVFGLWSFCKKRNKLAELTPKNRYIYFPNSVQVQSIIGGLTRIFPFLPLQVRDMAANINLSGSSGVDAQGMDDYSAPSTGLSGLERQGCLQIVYATQTGNTETLAHQLSEKFQHVGVKVNVGSSINTDIADLNQFSHMLFIVSTQGNGDIPDEALDLYGELTKESIKANVTGLSYAVLALGDSCYDYFCQAGKAFDQALDQAGAKCFYPRQEFDVDFDDQIQPWFNAYFGRLQAHPDFNKGTENQDITSHVDVDAKSTALENTAPYGKTNPVAAVVQQRYQLTGAGSAKNIQHVELNFEHSDLHYQAGDSVGIWFRNAPSLVMDILSLSQLSASTWVTVDDQPLSLYEALCSKYELTLLHPGFVSTYANLAGYDKLLKIINNKAELRAYLSDRQVVNVLNDFPQALSAEQLLSCMRRLSPRSYSIASSPLVQPNSLALTVGVVRYQQGDKLNVGAASSFLGERLCIGELLSVFIERNDKFRLPIEHSTPIIMIGAGTGIAPFRAFLQERAAMNATGDNWLFFGNPCAADDYLYEIEFNDYSKQGLLTRIDLAFSQDQSSKVYVQQRMLEQADTLFAWLEKGAYVYVCGGTGMAEAVQEQLQCLIQDCGQLNQDQARDYVSMLRRNNRYQRDVY